MLHIAIADADDAVRTYMRVVLADAGFRVSVAATASEVRELLAGVRGGPVDCLITDDRLRVGSAFDAFEEAQKCGWADDLRLVVCSHDLLASAEAEMRSLPIAQVLQKPCAPEALIAAATMSASTTSTLQ